MTEYDKNIERAKQIIVEEVYAVQGIKPGELIVREKITNLVVQGFDVVALIESLVLEKRLTEVCYVLPNMQFRQKSFLLPGGTVVEGINGI